jgi:hypothetical protein
MLHRLLLFTVMGLPFWAMGQTFNGGFENLAPNGIPMGWSIADPSGAATTKDAHIGKVAAKAWICKTYLPGTWNSKIDVSQGNAREVTGYYKYLGEGSECDKATVRYILGARSEDGAIDTLAYGDTELKLSNNYKKFALSVSSTGSGTPDFVNIQFQPAGHCNIHGAENCCFLYVDDVVLAGSTSIRSSPDPEEASDPEEATEAKGKKGKKGEIEEEDGGGMDSIPSPLENKVQPEETAEEVEAEVEEPAEEAIEVEEATEEGTEGTEGDPAEKTAGEAGETPVEEEGSEPVDEEWNSEEESSDGGR